LVALGEGKGRALVGEIADRYDHLAFDGRDRLGQIHKQGFKNEAGTAYSDCVHLARLGANGGALWHGPFGTRITSVHLDDAGVLVGIHGRLDMTAQGAGAPSIPEGEPLEVRIPWRSGDEPTSGVLGSLIQTALEGAGQ
jgi:hypothetical protein